MCGIPGSRSAIAERPAISKRAASIRPLSRVIDDRMRDFGCPRSTDGDVRPPKDQPVHIRREKRRRGKIVTIVEGLDPSASDLGAILRQLKSACAAGGTVNGGIIEVQGDHTKRVVAILEGLGYPAQRSGG